MERKAFRPVVPHCALPIAHCLFLLVIGHWSLVIALAMAGCAKTPRVVERVPGLEPAHASVGALLPAHPLWAELEAVERELAQQPGPTDHGVELDYPTAELTYPVPEERPAEPGQVRQEAQGAVAEASSLLIPYSEKRRERTLQQTQRDYADERSQLSALTETRSEEAERRVVQRRLEAARRTAIPRAAAEIPALTTGQSPETYREDIERLHRTVEAETRTQSLEEAARLRARWNREAMQSRETHDSRTEQIESESRRTRGALEMQSQAEMRSAQGFFEAAPPKAVSKPSIDLRHGQAVGQELEAGMERARAADASGLDRRRSALLERRDALRRQILEDITRAAPLVARTHHVDLALDEPIGRDLTDRVREWLRAYYEGGASGES